MSSVLLGILLAALGQTIVGPALPTIIRDLNGFDYYTWVVTIYLLTSTISVPIAGKLSDSRRFPGAVESHEHNHDRRGRGKVEFGLFSPK